MQAPIPRTSPGNIAGADADVVLLHQAKHRRQDLWIVTEIRVHPGDEVVSLLDGVLESGDVRRTKPQLPGAFDHMDLVQCCGDCPGSVGRPVINDDDVEVRARLMNRGHQGPDVLRLVVRWDNDDRLHRFSLR